MTVVPRVPQAEKSRVMRERLLDATVEVLLENGWAGTTTTLVAQRAGVSRGAQLHHFPSKHDLVFAAVGHLGERMRTKLDSDQIARIMGLRGLRRTQAALDLTVEQLLSPAFVASLELWVAARTDAELRAVVTPLERRWGRSTHTMFVQLLGVQDSNPAVRALLQGTLDLVRGLALATVLGDDSARRAPIVRVWASVLHEQLTAQGAIHD